MTKRESDNRTLRNGAKAYLDQIYPAHDTDVLAQKVINAFWPNGVPKRKLKRRPGNALWSQKDVLLITYGNTFVDGVHKPLDLLNDFLKRYVDGMINGVHILPFFPFTSDDGFAVTDFRTVNPQLGDWADINRIATGVNLMSDLVLNHVSSQGSWFTDYLQSKAPYDSYFCEASPADDLDMVVRPRTTPLLKQVQTSKGPRHVWCTFSHDQIDLDFRNPEVLLEFIDIIRLHIDNGVRIIRLDAVAFIWKEVGTPSIHLPPAHAIVKLLRFLCDFSVEPVILVTETNVPKAENLSYFGKRDEAHVIYNFPLPPLILHALLTGTAERLVKWQRAMPPAPLGCAYLNFTASHDGIGMRPAEGLLTEQDQKEVIDTVRRIGGLISMRALPTGDQAPYELNTTFFEALRETTKGPDTHHLARFLCSQTIPMSLEGIPAFYVHSLLATSNDLDSVKKRGMKRAINRHRWDYGDLRDQLARPASIHARVLAGLRKRLEIRKRQAAFHPNATQFTLNTGDHRVFGIWRQSLDRQQSIFALHNVSDTTLRVPSSTLNLIADEEWTDLLTHEEEIGSEIDLAPYQCRWITNMSQR
ncbi:MAG: sugar phosphorylase [Pseudomonadota bacterium]